MENNVNEENAEIAENAKISARKMPKVSNKENVNNLGSCASVVFAFRQWWLNIFHNIVCVKKIYLLKPSSTI